MEITPKAGKFAHTASGRRSDRTGLAFQLNLNPVFIRGISNKNIQVLNITSLRIDKKDNSQEYILVPERQDTKYSLIVILKNIFMAEGNQH